jgi:hypothetical protein
VGLEQVEPQRYPASPALLARAAQRALAALETPHQTTHLTTLLEVRQAAAAVVVGHQEPTVMAAQAARQQAHLPVALPTAATAPTLSVDRDREAVGEWAARRVLAALEASEAPLERVAAAVAAEVTRSTAAMVEQHTAKFSAYKIQKENR